MDDAPDLSTALSTLLSDSALMSRISDIVNGSPATAESAVKVPPPDAADAIVASAVPPGNMASSGLGGLLSNPDVMEKLPQVMATIAPMLNGEDNGGSAVAASSSHSGSHRTALLCALKPYLSPRRRQAIDYIIRLEKIGSLLHAIK